MAGACGKRAQGHKVATADIAAARRVWFATARSIGFAIQPLRRGSWVGNPRWRCPPRLRSTPVPRDARAGRRSTARGVHVSGLPECDGFRGYAQHPRHFHQRAVRRGRSSITSCRSLRRACCRSIPTSRRRRPHPHLRVRLCRERAGADVPMRTFKTRAQPELRRRDARGGARVRELQPELLLPGVAGRRRRRNIVLLQDDGSSGPGDGRGHPASRGRAPGGG